MEEHNALITCIVQRDTEGLLIKLRSICDVKVLLDTPTRQGYTPLAIASGRGATEITRVLLDNGASVDKASPDDACSALMYACSGGHLDTVNILLEKGASVHMTDSEGWSPLFYACASSRDGATEVVKRLLEELRHLQKVGVEGAAGGGGGGQERERLQNVGAEGARGGGGPERERPRADLISAHVIDRKDEFGSCALLLASKRGNVESTVLLMRAGADALVRDGEGYTASARARECGHAALLAVIEEESRWRRRGWLVVLREIDTLASPLVHEPTNSSIPGGRQHASLKALQIADS